MNKNSVTRSIVLAFAFALALPLAGFAQSRGRNNSGRWGDKCDKFVNCHDARDGRVDQRNSRRDRRDDRNDRNNRDDRYGNNGGYGNNGSYGNNGGYRNNDNYGNYGGSADLRQTALNAGYNEGMQEGRRDRSNNDRYDYSDESAYRNATKDYSSRLGNRALYQQYFREAFATGYRDGYRGN
jgi:hypothetical protein